MSSREGACKVARAVMGLKDAELNEEPEAEDHDADQGQGASDAPAPELDGVGPAVRVHGILGTKMISGPPAHAGERRGSQSLRVLLHALQRLAGLRGLAGFTLPVVHRSLPA